MSRPSGLSGRCAVVTGASSGIGASIATRLVEAGANVVTGSRSEPTILGATWVPTDVADPAQTKALIDTAVSTHGTIDIVVNNAGVQVEKTVADTTDDEFDLVFDINVRGVFNMCRAAVLQMAQQPDGGSIVNIGSISGNVADHGMAVYNASKGAVHALTRSIAIDHGHQRIRCNAVCPGWIGTALADAAFALTTDPDAAMAEAVARHPVGRLGTPDDVAALVVWLAGDDATFVTGASFTIDGGLTAQSPIG